MADALGSGSSVHRTCGFKSRPGYNKLAELKTLLFLFISDLRFALSQGIVFGAQSTREREKTLHRIAILF